MTKNKYIKGLRKQLQWRLVRYNKHVYEINNIWVKNSRKETYVFTFNYPGDKHGVCDIGESDSFVLEEVQNLLKGEEVKGFKLIKED